MLGTPQFSKPIAAHQLVQKNRRYGVRDQPALCYYALSMADQGATEGMLPWRNVMRRTPASMPLGSHERLRRMGLSSVNRALYRDAHDRRTGRDEGSSFRPRSTGKAFSGAAAD
jgi:hypothetical protein